MVTMAGTSLVAVEMKTNGKMDHNQREMTAKMAMENEGKERCP